MNTADINTVLGSDPRTGLIYIGCHPLGIAALKIRGANAPFLMVFNTQRAHLPGEHWIAISAEQSKCYYFDSYGRSPDHYPEISHSLKRKFDSVHYNGEQLQGLTTSACGDYCVLFCLLISRGWTAVKIIKRLKNVQSFELRDHAVRATLLELYGDGVFHSMHPPDSQNYIGDDFLHVKRAIEAVENVFGNS